MSQLGISLDADTSSQLQDINRDFQREGSDARRGQFFDEQNAVIRRQRADTDLTQRTAEREVDINTQAEAIATAISDALTPLFSEQSQFATQQMTAAEASTAAVPSTENAATATQAARMAATAAETGLTEAANAATQLNETVTALDSTLAAFENITSNLSQLDFTQLAQAIEDMPADFAGELEAVIQRLLLAAATPEDVAAAVFFRVSDLLLIPRDIDPRQSAFATEDPAADALATDAWTGRDGRCD